ncbi:HNH endonuclease [Arthrobacter sp. B3I4]|uniref:HNH endonuclease n=1 Tax=Arthrobacter sp. B3I4 TaxID=3042267 RepID=UPI0027809954|nr:hypothetical protein [Arthrobacter sp. B3I4]MDQ0757307.1 hypothetical protein [Arthrobacter sp. B3I4]
MPRPLNSFEEANTEFLERIRVDYGYLQPTENGLSNSIIDATQEFRDFLQPAIHEYDEQPWDGKTNGRRLPASIILGGNTVDLPKANLYRARTRGDRRIWFPGIPRYVGGGETLLTLWLNDRFWLLNASRLEFDASPALSFVLQNHVTLTRGDGSLGRPDSFWGGAETDRTALRKVRAEQAHLRQHLLQGRAHGRCSICAAELPARLLVAGHIKPRSRCSENERLDYLSAAMLVCNLGCDALFEWGYIVVDGAGIVRPARAPETLAVKASVDALLGRTCLAFNAHTSVNFATHASLNL